VNNPGSKLSPNKDRLNYRTHATHHKQYSITISDVFSNQEIERRVKSAARTLVTVGALMPSEESLATEVQDALAATERGYFLPDEDERVRTAFAQYLRTRKALHQNLAELRPLVLKKRKVPAEYHAQVFTVAWCTACLLVRSGRYLIDNFRKNDIVRSKLDEAEPRFGIARKEFSQIYKSLTSPRNIWIFLTGVKQAETSRAEIESLSDHPVVGPIVSMLQAEEPWIESSARYYTKGRFKYRWHSFLRRHQSGYRNVSFAIFKLSGSLIAELRLHWKRKRVTPGVQRKIAKLLQPGDVIITRHDDATTNIFLPGFWPHAALHIGTAQQRNQIGVAMEPERAKRCTDPIRILEARKDGVRLRELSDTLSVDCCTVLRPQLETQDIAAAISTALTHEGKQYDFEFDFRRANKLVCTEVVYRSFHGVGDIKFVLSKRAGRLCLSAEDLIDLAIEGNVYKPVCVYGVNRNRFHGDEESARAALLATRNRTKSVPDDSTLSDSAC
jgi:hypothetical protein